MSDERVTFHIGVDVIVRRGNSILLGLRKHVFGAGTWGLPGGHLENHEKMADTATRELQEETGLLAQRVIFSSLVNLWERDEHYIKVTFVAKEVEGEVQLMEPDYCEEWQWFDLDQLPEHILIGNREQIDLYKNGQQPFADA